MQLYFLLKRTRSFRWTKRVDLQDINAAVDAALKGARELLANAIFHGEALKG
jgi:hypothetical protein